MSLDARILASLRGVGTGAVSGAELAHQLGVSRAAIWARIEDLRALDYEIEASPHQGYRLLAAPDLLLADDLLSRLGAVKVIGRDIRVFKQTTSTNDAITRVGGGGSDASGFRRRAKGFGSRSCFGPPCAPRRQPN